MCEAADFGQVNVAAQVDFKRTRGVWRGLLTEQPPPRRAQKPGARSPASTNTATPLTMTMTMTTIRCGAASSAASSDP